MVKKSINELKKEYRESNDNYFEAIVQLRHFTEEQFHAVVDYIEEHDCRITKFVEQPNGIDLYLFSQRFTQKLSRWAKDNYNCQTEMTSTLHTRDTRAGKDLYRITLLIKFVKYKIGQIIEYKGEEVRILTLGKKPSGKILSTGKRTFIDVNFLV